LFRAATVPGYSFQSIPLTSVVYPSRGHRLHSGCPPAFVDANRLDHFRRFRETSTPLVGAVAKVLRGAGSLSEGPKASFPVASSQRQRTVYGKSRAKHRPLTHASSVSKPSSVSPFTTRTGFPVQAAVTLLGFRPSRAPLKHLGFSTRPSLRSNTRLAPWYRCFVGRL